MRRPRSGLPVAYLFRVYTTPAQNEHHHAVFFSNPNMSLGCCALTVAGPSLSVAKLARFASNANASEPLTQTQTGTNPDHDEDSPGCCDVARRNQTHGHSLAGGKLSVRTWLCLSHSCIRPCNAPRASCTGFDAVAAADHGALSHHRTTTSHPCIATVVVR